MPSGPIVHVPREATPEELERYRQEVEDNLNLATQQAYDRAGGDLSRAIPGSAGAKSTKPGLWLKTYRAATSFARPVAPLLLGLRERRGKEEPLRRNERLGQPRVKRPAGRLAWFHAASVGETNAILPLMAALAQKRPALSFLLTTGTVTSAKLAAQRLGPRAIHQFAPLDTPEYVASFLDHWRPDLAVFTEFGDLAQPDPGKLGARHSAGARQRPHDEALVPPLAAQSGLRPSAVQPLRSRAGAERDRWRGASPRSARRTPSPAGNLKVDAPAPLVDDAEFERLRPALQGRPLLIAACTHEGEDEIVADAHRLLAASFPGLCTIIAPRHPQRGGAIAEMLKGRGFKVAQRSLGQLPDRTSDVYVADTIGELGMLYKLAPVAFIGGSLVDRGGHNPIEAMRLGAVVLMGPHWQNFADAYDALVKNGGAIVVQSAEEIAGAARKLLSDEAELASMRSRANAALATISGALPRTHRGSAALPAGRGRLGACVLTSRPGGTRQAPSRLATFLQPLGALYGRVAAARYFRATPYRSRLPVICIGNFTAGGTGKTPLAIHLCERLKAAGHEPAALTRGYGGRLSGTLLGQRHHRRGARRGRRGAAARAGRRRRWSPATAGWARAPSRSGRIP